MAQPHLRNLALSLSSTKETILGLNAALRYFSNDADTAANNYDAITEQLQVLSAARKTVRDVVQAGCLDRVATPIEEIGERGLGHDSSSRDESYLEYASSSSSHNILDALSSSVFD